MFYRNLQTKHSMVSLNRGRGANILLCRTHISNINVMMYWKPGLFHVQLGILCMIMTALQTSFSLPLTLSLSPKWFGDIFPFSYVHLSAVYGYVAVAIHQLRLFDLCSMHFMLEKHQKVNIFSGYHKNVCLL